MNRLDGFERLGNRYVALRHGHSRANALGIVVSDPANGRDGYGLTPDGRREVTRAVRALGRVLVPDVIVSSDFRRARESAEILRARLAPSAAIEIDARLRERRFGEFELGPNDIYPRVWREDGKDADAAPGGAESANAVMARVTALVADFERRYQGAGVVLVSHGDPLQILEAAFAGLPASSHRRLEHLDTAGFRELRLARGGPRPRGDAP